MGETISLVRDAYYCKGYAQALMDLMQYIKPLGANIDSLDLMEKFVKPRADINGSELVIISSLLDSPNQ